MRRRTLMAALPALPALTLVSVDARARLGKACARASTLANAKAGKAGMAVMRVLRRMSLIPIQ